MAKKESSYFETFSNMAKSAVKSAEQLDEMLHNYVDVVKKADAIHETEHESDSFFHEMMIELNKAFITPIDREDIIDLADTLDSIVDAVEDVSNLFDMLSVDKVRPEALDMTELIVKCTKCLLEAVNEFKNFKDSKKLTDLNIEVNHYEEEGDRLHRRIIKELYLSGEETLTVMKWKEIFDTMERVLDLCEDAADLLKGLVIKNG